MKYPTMMPQEILKRDGRVVGFDGAKIVHAIAAAGQASGEVDAAAAEILGARVVARLAGHACPGIETIQNLVENALVEAGCWHTARAYIVYRERHARLRSLQHTLVDVESRSEEHTSELQSLLRHSYAALRITPRLLSLSTPAPLRLCALAGQASGEVDAAAAERLGARWVARLAGHACPGIETSQNLVENALVEAGCWHTARAYIVYRERHARLRSLQHTLVDVESSMEEYLDQRDWRVNANANQGYSLGGLILNVAGKVTANYWLSHIYSPAAGQAHRDGDIHIHDLDMLSGYCAGWSLRQLLTEGFNGIPGKVEATPARHLSAAIGQIVNFLGTLQHAWAGAQASSRPEKRRAGKELWREGRFRVS